MRSVDGFHPEVSMDEELDELRLMAYLDGSCGPDERAAVEAWAARDPANRLLVERLRAAWNPAPPPAFDPDDRLRRRLQRSIAAAESAGSRGSSRASEPAAQRAGVGPRRWRLRPAGIAAALVAAAAGVVVVTHSTIPWLQPTPSAAPAPAPAREIATPRGQRAVFTLRDGTRVMLDADSRLREESEREVQLVGRAYFQVPHDSTRTFRVRTATSVVEDLGTEFVVTAFPEQKETRVAVASGAVAVHAAAARPADPPLATLERGGMAWVDSSGLARIAHHIDVASELAWTEGRHEFRRAPVGEALVELGRWYDVEFRAADPALLRRRLTVSFGDAALPHVLEVLSVSLGVRAEQRGSVVTLVPTATSSPNLPSVER